MAAVPSAAENANGKRLTLLDPVIRAQAHNPAPSPLRTLEVLPRRLSVLADHRSTKEGSNATASWELTAAGSQARKLGIAVHRIRLRALPHVLPLIRDTIVSCSEKKLIRDEDQRDPQIPGHGAGGQAMFPAGRSSPCMVATRDFIRQV